VPCGHEPGDHLAIEEGPRRLTVHEEHGRGGARSLVDVVDPYAVEVEVVGLVGPSGESVEAVVGGAQEVHGSVVPWAKV
jgi:hypothetical protein